MTETPGNLDLAEVRKDIHGEAVRSGRDCDYCGANLDYEEPVMYDVIRLADMPSLEEMFGHQSGWFADASRCRQCERETVAPATEGVDEAIVMVELVERNGVLSIDASSLTAVDYSADDDGYQPPKIDLGLMMTYRDIGLGRWMRVQWVLKHGDPSSNTVPVIRTLVKVSPDVPPDLQ